MPHNTDKLPTEKDIRQQKLQEERVRKNNLWYARWEPLYNNLRKGSVETSLKAVWALLDDINAFGYEHISKSALAQLNLLLRDKGESRPAEEWKKFRFTKQHNWKIDTGDNYFIDCGNESNSEDNADLIIAVVNACMKVNPDNPIAAAEALPDMLTVLENLLSVYGIEESCFVPPSYWSDAIAAINKAKGGN